MLLRSGFSNLWVSWMWLGLFLVFWLIPFAASAGEGGHPLQGRIYFPSEKRFISEPDLTEMMKQAQVVYLGEKHDNPRHHELQAKLLQSMVDEGRKPAVVFEMFSRDVNPSLTALLKDPKADLAKVPQIVGWDKTGWPDWGMYAPLVEIAHRAGLPVLGGDVSRTLARQIGRRGTKALPAKLAKELSLGPPEASHKALLLDDLYESHCRMAPRESLGNLYEAWRVRNRVMALSILSAFRGGKQKGVDGAVMITGNGHADRLRGIPRHISELAPSVKQFSLGLIEVEPGEVQPDSYLEPPGSYDAVWFTELHDREDPCVEFRKSLEKMRKSHQQVR